MEIDLAFSEWISVIPFVFSHGSGVRGGGGAGRPNLPARGVPGLNGHHNFLGMVFKLSFYHLIPSLGEVISTTDHRARVQP